MKKLFAAIIGILSLSVSVFAADDVVGFWKTVSEETGKAESVVAIYSYQGKYYGRIIATYNDEGQIKDTIYSPHERAPGVEGNPYYVGLDFIWDLKSNGDNKYTGGNIMDPEKGRVYGADMWTNNGNLIVRGKLLIFGRNQTWPKATQNDLPEGFQFPDLNSLQPNIKNVKN